MSEYLNILIGLTVAGSGVLVLACLITYISKERMNAKWHYWNRKLSLFLFLIPIFLIPGLLHIVTKDNQLISIGNLSIVHRTAWLSTTFIQTVFIIWLIGVIVTSLWFLYWYQRFNKELRTNLLSVPQDSIVRQHLYTHLKNMKLANNVDIAFCQLSMSPVLIGTFKPTIVLPLYDIPNDELDMIIKNELTHYKKNDLWIQKIMLLASILHWYNPLIHVLRKEINKWCELSCDEDVVMEMSHAERKKYGGTILNMIQRSNQDLMPSFLGASFSTSSTNMKNRLMKILKVKKGGKPVVILSLAVLLALGSVGIVSATFAHENAPLVSEGIDQTDNESTTLEILDVSDDMEVEDDLGLISVKRSDESKFPKEEWEKILKQVENNEIIFEDE